MTPIEIRIKDLTTAGLKELAEAGCIIWGKSVHDDNILIFLKPEETPNAIQDTQTGEVLPHKDTYKNAPTSLQD